MQLIDPLPAADPVEDIGLDVTPSGGEEDVGGPADHLRGGVSVELLGAAVPAGHHAVQRLSDDRVVGRLHDRGEPVARLGGLAALCHVPDRR